MGRHLVWGLAFSLPPGFARRLVGQALACPGTTLVVPGSGIEKLGFKPLWTASPIVCLIALTRTKIQPRHSFEEKPRGSGTKIADAAVAHQIVSITTERFAG
jgi:hypothetical protein